MAHYTVCALYHFVRLEKLELLQADLLALMQEHSIKGTLLLAHEGINGTVASTREGIDVLMAFLKSDTRFQDIATKESPADRMPFLRSKVKLKKEIVTMGVEDLDPSRFSGTYVKPKDWNTLISDPNVVVVDTRNAYEVAIGTFRNAENPNTNTFREFPDYAAHQLETARKKKVAMFCTGGIRCEKSTAYLKQLGFEEVYHLEGGILKYLEDVPAEESLWEGECFVFDGRVSVKHGLAQGSYDQCHACRMPITEHDKTHAHYEQGISCQHCYDITSTEQKHRYAEREEQMQRAHDRGEVHMGDSVAAVATERRMQKKQQAEASAAQSKPSLQ